jgi:hypothetical protein
MRLEMQFGIGSGIKNYHFKYDDSQPLKVTSREVDLILRYAATYDTVQVLIVDVAYVLHVRTR